MTMFKEEFGWKKLDCADDTLITKIRLTHEGELISIGQEFIEEDCEGFPVHSVMLTMEELEEIYRLSKLYKHLNNRRGGIVGSEEE